MKKISLILFLCCPFLMMAQSVLTHADYLNNPTEYVSKIPQSKINSKILIDRIFYDDIVMNVNGNNKVSTISCPDWATIYENLKSASYDTLSFPSLGFLTNVRNEIYQSQNAYPIGILDYRFQKINQSALDNGQLKQEVTYLRDVSANATSFSTERVIAASCLEHSIYGDNVKFYIDNFFVFSNNATQKLAKIEVDFGNGSGFQEVRMNSNVDVQYSSQSGYIQLVVKLTFRHLQTNAEEILYSHSSVFRKGSNAVPLPSAICPPNNVCNDGTNKNITPHHFVGFYPKESFVLKESCINRYNPQQQTHTKICTTYNTIDTTNCKIKYYILYANENNKKLRKPFIVCDGFDPGNKRDYYRYSFDISTYDLLPNEHDDRGLFELINGNNSPWYRGKPVAYLIDYLRSEGYDLVIVNFINGADDVITNGEAFRGFLKDVINVNRDNKMEESIVVGLSMGGLITRYALKTMENANEEHYVKTWISFDSPHKGAYIPLGLQHTVNFFKDINTGGIADLEKAKASFQRGVNSLSSTAAQQMLLYHFKNTNDAGLPTPLFDGLYNKLNTLGYPTQCKNYAITNGGTGLLYPNQQQIIDFRAEERVLWINVMGHFNGQAYGNTNGDEKSILFKGSRQGLNNDVTIETKNKTAFENAPGGWHPGLYSINCNESNKYKKADDDYPYTRATFISTASAFGIEPNRENVHKNRTNFTAGQTPFDSIHGMNENEEHVRISKNTRDYLLLQLRNDFNESHYPLVRQNQTVHEKVSSSVAYHGKKMIFGKTKNSTFTIKNTANVTMNAQSSMEFLPGFSVEKGAKLTANILPNINNSTVLRKEIPQREEDINSPSPFIGKVYNYAIDEQNPILLTQTATAIVSPNPCQNNITLTIESNGFEISTNEKITVQFYNVIGNKVMEKELYSHELKNIDVSQLSTGVYIVHVLIPNYEVITLKIVKI